MSRPRLKNKRKRYNITLPPALHKGAAKIAFNEGRTLSSVIEELLAVRLAEGSK